MRNINTKIIIINTEGLSKTFQHLIRNVMEVPDEDFGGPHHPIFLRCFCKMWLGEMTHP